MLSIMFIDFIDRHFDSFKSNTNPIVVIFTVIFWITFTLLFLILDAWFITIELIIFIIYTLVITIKDKIKSIKEKKSNE